MNFFEHQDRARRNTRRLVALFGLAVAAIVVAVYAAVVAFLMTTEAGHYVAEGGLAAPEVLVPVLAGTLFVIAAGSGYKTLQLSGGGPVVARLLGGRPLDPNSGDPDERRVLNVVEEMAIAAGTPVPDVYLLAGEHGINAFAAGRTPADAVVGVTGGTARQLSRDELQGVVAHEFSHILNGDMRLNLRLIGVIHGILVISLIGYFIMRAGGRSRPSGRKKGGGAAIALLGLALYVIGWIGVFFGRLIKAGVSRQREFLADAAAVQFTRNPLGIAGALKKIGGHGAGSRIGHRRAEEASHLFFSNALKKSFLGLTATHPPLDERIRRIDPSFDSTFPVVEYPPGERRAAAPEGALGPEARPAGRGAIPLPGIPFPGAAALAGAASAPARVAESVGTLDPAHVAWATTLLAELPAGLREAAHEPTAARALTFALLLDADPEVRSRQLEALGRSSEPAVATETRRLLLRLESLRPEARIPLLDLALPALRRLSPEQYRSYRTMVRALADADGRVSLLEYTLHRMLLRHLDPHFGAPRRKGVQFYSLKGLGQEVSCLLSLLARAGVQPGTADGGEEVAAAAVAAGARELAQAGLEPRLVEREACRLRDLDGALERLALAAPRLKERLLRAAVAVVVHDREVTREEGELLRAVADGLDCPVPPFLRAAEG
ncbi:MAG TPA: M48 family metallopeptidase [Thermoanaerobaculia bacterium]|nr:M48 family metallopeptidase [Thermoanaerobaculia bacterium]